MGAFFMKGDDIYVVKLVFPMFEIFYIGFFTVTLMIKIYISLMNRKLNNSMILYCLIVYYLE